MRDNAKKTPLPDAKTDAASPIKDQESTGLLCDKLFADRDWDPDRQAERFLKSLPDSGNILLTSHDNPDPDALASCMALQKLIEAKKGVKPRIAIGGILGRAENRAMSIELEIDLYPIDILEDKPWEAIVMVDAQPGSGNSHLPANVPVTAVIDHHPQRKSLKAPFVDIRPEYGAVSTILVEYLRGQGVNWDAKLATALLYAIKSETADLGRGICNVDQLAYFALFESVDWELLHRILKAKIPGDYFALFLRGIKGGTLYGNALVTNLGEIPVPDAVAEIADFLLRHENVSRSLVLGRYEDQIVFSIRFTGSDLDAGVIASTITRDLGTGGGHDLMAGGRIILKKSKLKKADEIFTTLIDRFLVLIGSDKLKNGKPLLELQSDKGE
ncbi:phosphoesterase [candidate division LCP-89 bacterium B3_LCP]|uniref:Phosphoesterase n=1 Tax=candidate division LCP-89 bacterium B3_LCP TaxID=2012998 RepID=A0A532V5F2_UNCL8|nr:MAG: phosphoesterase [candidate division LCP-89 bacterium B3_LCP]